MNHSNILGIISGLGITLKNINTKWADDLYANPLSLEDLEKIDRILPDNLMCSNVNGFFVVCEKEVEEPYPAELEAQCMRAVGAW